MPDALSKTVPIWCCVLNRALFPGAAASHALFVPPNVVSVSERSQMEARLPEFLGSFVALQLDLESLRRQISKPLRPLWITHDDDHDLSSDFLEAVAARSHPVVCCTSSRQVVGAEISEGGYIQGAGDDTENWALGLTAPIFWAHAGELLATPDADLPGLIKSLLIESAAAHGNADAASADVHRLTPFLSVGTLASLESPAAAGSCVIGLTATSTDRSAWMKTPCRMEVGLGKRKAASRLLRQALPQICDFVADYLAKKPEAGDQNMAEKKVVVLCETGKDLSVGVALALSCWCFDAAGNILPGNDRGVFNKAAIRVRLGHIMTALPSANPSRATLQSVNSFLMDWRK